MTKPTHTSTTQAIAASLYDMRRGLLERIAEQRGGVVSRADMAADHFAHSEDSRAQTNAAKYLEFALNERETEELIAIDAALARLHTGHYGQCVNCTKPITPARLRATPEASRCITCQQKFELAT